MIDSRKTTAVIQRRKATMINWKGTIMPNTTATRRRRRRSTIPRFGCSVSTSALHLALRSGGQSPSPPKSSGATIPEHSPHAPHWQIKYFFSQ